MGEKLECSEEILSVIQEKIQNNNFVKYMDFCLSRWNRLETNLKIIDTVISIVCKKWNITEEELLHEKRKHSEARAMMYYIVKNQIKLSYGEMSYMFHKHKSFIKKSVDVISELLEDCSKKNKGEIALSKNESLILMAYGNPNEDSVMQARNILKMRGIDWNNENNLSLSDYFLLNPFELFLSSIKKELMDKNIDVSLLE
jgi:hypothetical protein